MKLLTDLELKSVYRLGNQDLLKEFYRPTLRLAVQYDRAVGFFSAETLTANLKGIIELVKNQGKMRLIIGHPLTDSEFEAVKQGNTAKEVVGYLDSKLVSILEKLDTGNNICLEVLALLIASGKLEVKYALRKQGMYHEKIGIIHDAKKNKIVFTGSANETIYALSDGFNAESISVYKSWDCNNYKDYGEPFEQGFEELWNGKQPHTITIDVPSEFYERISKSSNKELNIYDLESKENEVYNIFDEQGFYGRPKIPREINGKDFSIFNHQVLAIKEWVANKYIGILQLSTGSGKTITSIYAATKLYEARSSKNVGTLLIVSVPYQELAKQWVESLKLFNINPVKCWQSKSQWNKELGSEILSLNMGAKDFVALVVVNRTMESDLFQEHINKVDSSMIVFIGDECHNHGSKRTNEALPNAYYRMGLSATPYRSDDDEIETPFPNDAKDRINNYYNKIVSVYSLGDAINDGVLCEYKYYIIPVYLTEEEQERYEELTSEIGKVISQGGSAGLSPSLKNQFTILCGKRSRLLGSAANKIEMLEYVNSKINKEDRNYSLFYCGEGTINNTSEQDDSDLKVIESVSIKLDSLGWQTSRFTSNETPKTRNEIMNNFVSGHINALVSMKVLDEGVDVPVCNKAFILASTRNPRQYVQRRGRVLRKYKNKTHADIYDFVTLPLNRCAASKRLIEAELERVDDFIKLACNRYESEMFIKQLKLRD